MSEVIYHNAIVTEIMPKSVKVRIERGTACDTCYNKSACNISAGTSSMIYVINTAEAGTFSVGETVKVGIGAHAGLKAIWYAYIIPLILMALAFAVCYCFTSNELWQALAALGVLVIYYLILSRYKHKFNSKFNYTVEKLYHIED
ncbi:MAG: SoxR reducing system RseC family protein [Bacteroidales bacterium]|nr:SoxR reducing system RseC family protein [Bacteroidales bacterium]